MGLVQYQPLPFHLMIHPEHTHSHQVYASTPYMRLCTSSAYTTRASSPATCKSFYFVSQPSLASCTGTRVLRRSFPPLPFHLSYLLSSFLRNYPVPPEFIKCSSPILENPHRRHPRSPTSFKNPDCCNTSRPANPDSNLANGFKQGRSRNVGVRFSELITV